MDSDFVRRQGNTLLADAIDYTDAKGTTIMRQDGAYVVSRNGGERLTDVFEVPLWVVEALDHRARVDALPADAIERLRNEGIM